MRHWITVHWPHPVGGELPWSVYLRKKYKSLGGELLPGDQILFYQTENALDEDRSILHEAVRIETGAVVRLQTKPHGLLGVGVATTALGDRPTARIQFRYGDSDPCDWAFEALCETEIFRNSVAHGKVQRVLGYRMFFPGGLRQITEAQFDELLGKLRSANRKT